MKYLVGAACIAIIAASGVYLAGEYNAYAAQKAAESAAVEQIIARATANKRIQEDFRAWSKAHAEADNRAHAEMTNPCFVAVSKLRAIKTAVAAKVSPIYSDEPSVLRTQINACVKEGTYTEAQISDVLN